MRPGQADKQNINVEPSKRQQLSQHRDSEQHQTDEKIFQKGSVIHQNGHPLRTRGTPANPKYVSHFSSTKNSGEYKLKCTRPKGCINL